MKKFLFIIIYHIKSNFPTIFKKKKINDCQICDYFLLQILGAIYKIHWIHQYSN